MFYIVMCCAMVTSDFYHLVMGTQHDHATSEIPTAGESHANDIIVSKTGLHGAAMSRWCITQNPYNSYDFSEHPVVCSSEAPVLVVLYPYAGAVLHDWCGGNIMSEEPVAPPSAVTMRDVQQLIARKDEIEAQIKAYHEVLEDQKNVGMDGPLVDIEGYPRADVDIYQVRTARHNIICLQNDHKAIMKEIEEALHNLHARDKEKRKKDEAEAQAEALQHNQALPGAFARVDTVTPGSPASISGLQVGDEIVAFGSVNTSNFQTLQNIASVVQHSEGKPLSVTVVRDGKSVNLGLTPQRWSGKGLLGCNIIPIKR